MRKKPIYLDLEMFAYQSDADIAEPSEALRQTEYKIYIT